MCGRKHNKMEMLETSKAQAQTSIICHISNSALRECYSQADGKISKLKSIEIGPTNGRRIC